MKNSGNQTVAVKRSQRTPAIPLSERAAFSPGEFATLFGRQKVWGYRQCYLGRVKAITKFGRMLIPRSEIDRILATAEPYNGRG
jgi:hypothetical protein